MGLGDSVMKHLDELVNVEESTWSDLVLQWVQGATNSVDILQTASVEEAGKALVDTQITTKSPMGAIIYNCGGILVDGGWLRIFGGGCEKLQSLPACNRWDREGTRPAPPRYVLVGDDCVGGFFALDGDGSLGGVARNVCYFAPDTLEWEDTERSYSDWVQWCLTGDLNLFYKDYRWPSWRTDVGALPSWNHGFLLYPFPSTDDGSNLSERTRGVVPMSQLWDLFVGQ